MAAKKKAKTKVVKKEWYEVQAPKQFGRAIIGEITSSDPKLLIGRRLNISLSELTRNMRLQGIHLKLRIHDVSTKKAVTIVEGYEILSSMLKRYVRRNRTRIDDSFVVETKDDIRVRVKPILVTAFKSKGDVSKNLLITSKELLHKEISNLTYDDFVTSVVNHRLQSGLIRKLAKVYPVKYFEIRKFEITKAKPTKIIYRKKTINLSGSNSKEKALNEKGKTEQK